MRNKAICDPYLSKGEIRRALKRAFPGPGRVSVSKVQPERINKHGEITHGAQGYLEYSMLDKTEIKFTDPEQKKAAVIAHAKLSATWGKRQRSFSMGKPLSVSGVKTDPNRVAELETMERLDHVKAKWDKLSYAEQFIHLWMSGMIAVVKRSNLWSKLGWHSKNRFQSLWGLIGKWFAQTSALETDFMEFLGASLE